MLTEAEIKQFGDDGFLILPGLIQGEKLERYLSLLHDLVARAHVTEIGAPHWSFERGPDNQPMPGFLHKVQGVAVVEPKILDIAREPEIVERAASLLGRNLDVFGTKFFPKLPGGGTSVRWHQDNYYFGTTTEQILSCGIYYEDTDPGNGCLRVAPGSHRSRDIAEHRPIVGGFGMETDVADEDAIDVCVPAGTVVFFSANLLHGTHDNTGDRSRFSTAWHYVPGDLALDRFPRDSGKDRHAILRP